VARRDLLAKVLGELDSGTAAPVPVDAPETGVLRNVSALPGQAVPAGAPLFEVVNLDTVWVRVPVYVGDRDELRTDGATVGPLNAPPGAKGRAGTLVAAPPAANPVSGTVDLFFAVQNAEPQWVPGQRVAVSLALNEPADALTVPWSAVLYDYFGGTWVYVKTADRTYSRERVLVRFVSGETAVLEDGPAVGKRVVATGAAELFGTETGFSK
jgi:membrane fusion protein, heavy metal efflux system